MHARLATAHYSKSFFVSTMLLPPERRWATFALYNFCRYVDNLIDNPRERSIAELKNEVECFRNELLLAYQKGESEHPIIKPYIFIAKRYGIPMEYPLDLLKGVLMDIEIARYDSFEELYLFCYRVAGVVGLMMTYVLGYNDDKAFEYAEQLGIAMQLTNILRDIKEDKDMQRIYLPLQELQQFKLSESDIIEERYNGHLKHFMRFQTKRAHDYYEMAAPGIPMLNAESRYAISSASKIYRGILHKIEARDYNPFKGRVYVPFMKKMGILSWELFRTRLLDAMFVKNNKTQQPVGKK
jgi:phytoene synthase